MGIKAGFKDKRIAICNGLKYLGGGKPVLAGGVCYGVSI